MDHTNQISFRLTGRFALFSDPVTRVGGEKCSYLVPTYEALKGVCESIYWKPTFLWVVDRVRVLKPFTSQSKGIRPIAFSGPSTLSIYTYLSDVAYEVEAHIEWNPLRPDLAADRNENKHFFMARRSLEKGGRRDIFLGTRECQGYVEPAAFGEAEPGAFDERPEMSFGLMFHGFDYGDEGEGGQLTARFWYPKMENGVIAFCRPEACPVKRVIKPYPAKPFTLGQNLRAVEEECP